MPDHSNSDKFAESNDSYRASADRLVKASTHGGKLNLDDLRYATKTEAQRIVFGSHGIDLATRDGAVQPLVNEQIANLSLATREVLGIIPQSEWKHNARDLLSNSIESLSHLVRGENQPTNGLTCKQDGHAVGFVDPDKSLASQNVVCEVPRTPNQQAPRSNGRQ